MKTEQNNNNNNEDTIMKTYVDEMFEERLEMVFKNYHFCTDDNVKQVVSEWKKNHPEDYENLKNDFYDEIHGEW